MIKRGQSQKEGFMKKYIWVIERSSTYERSYKFVVDFFNSTTRNKKGQWLNIHLRHNFENGAYQ